MFNLTKSDLVAILADPTTSVGVINNIASRLGLTPSASRAVTIARINAALLTAPDPTPILESDLTAPQPQASPSAQPRPTSMLRPGSVRPQTVDVGQILSTLLRDPAFQVALTDEVRHLLTRDAAVISMVVERLIEAGALKPLNKRLDEIQDGLKKETGARQALQEELMKELAAGRPLARRLLLWLKSH